MVGNILGLFDVYFDVYLRVHKLFGAVHYGKMPELFHQCKINIFGF